jgi:pyrimidine operon attenuation protein / uracil phosphoribosyltransferase
MRVLADGDRFEALIDSLCRGIEGAIGGSGDSDESGGTNAGGGAIGISGDKSGGGGWALVGVRSRGDVLAQRVAERMGAGRFGGRIGTLDITLYRDDLSEIGPQPVVRTTEIDFAIDGLNVVLIDDVLMTGRSVRAALQSLMDLGRPRRVWLGVLVDRGGRELPIGPDFVSLDLTDGSGEALGGSAKVQVMVRPTDERDAVVVFDEGEREGGERG